MPLFFDFLVIDFLVSDLVVTTFCEALFSAKQNRGGGIELV
jgi:hypothetical protein